MRKVQRYGWKKDSLDHRDRIMPPPSSAVVLPSWVNLMPKCPPVYDQGQLGSCTANAIGAAFEFELMRQGLTDFTPSRLFIYYNEREMEGDVNQDNGAEIRDGMKSIATLGVCSESIWPYIESEFSRKPTDVCYLDALENVAIEYRTLEQDPNHLKACLADGFPFVMGINVFKEFESQEVAQSGVVPMPGPKDPPIGGHAVMVVGYDDASQSFFVRNSWGSSWGAGGYFRLPYDYVLDSGLASDLWTIRTVQEDKTDSGPVPSAPEKKDASLPENPPSEASQGFVKVVNNGVESIVRLD